jgi:hypothetical protein
MTTPRPQAIVKADPSKDIYPIKVKDLAIPAAVAYLQARGCMPTDDGNGSDSDVAYGDDAFDEYM